MTLSIFHKFVSIQREPQLNLLVPSPASFFHLTDSTQQNRSESVNQAIKFILTVPKSGKIPKVTQERSFQCYCCCNFIKMLGKMMEIHGTSTRVVRRFERPMTQIDILLMISRNTKFLKSFEYTVVLKLLHLILLIFVPNFPGKKHF